MGDSSRSVLFLVIAGAAAVLFAIFHFAKPPPPELTAETERKILPKEALEMALQAGEGAAELPSDDPGEPELVPPGGEGETPPAEGGELMPADQPTEGTLSLVTEPSVSNTACPHGFIFSPWSPGR